MVCQQGRTHRRKCGQVYTHTNPAALVTGKAFWEQLARHHSGKTVVLLAIRTSGKTLLYPMQIQHVTSHCKNVFTATLALHLPKKCSGRVCRERASAYRAGELSSLSEICCLYSTAWTPVTL